MLLTKRQLEDAVRCISIDADINYAGYEHCVKCARGIIDAAQSVSEKQSLPYCY